MKNRKKYFFQRVFRVCRGLISSFYYSFILTKRNKTVIFNSACNEEFTWNAKSLFLNGREILNLMGYKTFFVIDDDVKRKNLIEVYGDYFISSKSPEGKRIILQAAVWVLSTLETPCSGLFLNRKRFVYHLGHGTPIKDIGLMERNLTFSKKIFYKINTTNISCYLSTSVYFIDYMMAAFGVPTNKIVVAPQPRVDDFLRKKKHKYIQKKNNYKYVLYAPTWRYDSDTKIFPFPLFNVTEFSEQLEKIKVIILLRLHPRFERVEDEFLSDNILSFDSKTCPDISDALSEFDALITDYSSIYCDYLLLDKPVAFIPYDIDSYQYDVGFSKSYFSITTDVKIKTTDDLLFFLTNINRLEYKKKQRELCEKLNYIPINESATEFNVRFINEEYKKRWPI